MRVYIAAPYSQPDVMLNIRAAVDLADQVLARGHIPFVPHLTGFWHLVSPRPYPFWMAYDNAWLLLCDVLLRGPGESPGADQEVLAAKEADIPVLYSIDDLPVEVSPFL